MYIKTIIMAPFQSQIMSQHSFQAVLSSCVPSDLQFCKVSAISLNPLLLAPTKNHRESKQQPIANAQPGVSLKIHLPCGFVQRPGRREGCG